MVLDRVEEIADAENARTFGVLDDAEREQLQELLLRVAEAGSRRPRRGRGTVAHGPHVSSTSTRPGQSPGRSTEGRFEVYRVGPMTLGRATVRAGRPEVRRTHVGAATGASVVRR